MKSLPLLLTFPVLLPLCTLQAASPLDRADGRLTLRDNGRKAQFRVVKDEVHRSKTDGGFQSVGVRGLSQVRQVIQAAKALQTQTGDPVDLIAYEDGKPQTEANKRLITKRVLVKLAEGVDPEMIMDATGAAGYNPLVFSPGNYQYFYTDVETALDVAELLRSVDGVLEAEVLLAKKLEPSMLPNDPFYLFSTASATGGPVTQTPNNSHINDDMVYRRYADIPDNLPPPWRFLEKTAVRPYQWYLNNTGEQIEHPGLLNWTRFDPPLDPVPITGNNIDNVITTAIPPNATAPPPHFLETGDAIVFMQGMQGGLGLINDEVTRYYVSSVPTTSTFTVSVSARPGSPVNFGSHITKGSFRLIARNPLRGWRRDIGGVLYPLGEAIGDQFVDINVAPVWGMRDPRGNPFPDDPGVFGNGLTIAIVDQGVNLKHKDLDSTLIDFSNDYNYLEPAKSTDPTPPTKAENHGTACAGVIFARHDNHIGLAGIAPKAKLLAIRIIGGFVTPVDMASAMIQGVKIDVTEPDDPKFPSSGKPDMDISSNSWGISQNGSGLMDEDQIFKDALQFGTSNGRLRKGIVYVFAAGNEGDFHENTNYSYPANSPYTLVVGGVTDYGRRVSYSNAGASLALVAPTKGDELPPRIYHEGNNKMTDLLNVEERPSATRGLFPRYPYRTVKPEDVPQTKRRSTQGILTLDNQTTASDGVERYNPNFDGTSAATPQVSGVAALVMEAGKTAGNDLTWRDVHEILMRSAYPVDFTSPMDDPLAPNGKRGFGEWVRGPLGNYMSNAYGYGCVNAEYAVRMAKVWTPANAQIIKEIAGPGGGRLIKDNSPNSPELISLLPPPPGMRLERVQVRVRIQHGRRGDLGITLVSPAVGQSGTEIESELFVPHREDFERNIGNYDLPAGTIPEDKDYYTFTTVRNWGARYGSDDGIPSGNFILKIWDNTNLGANTKPNAANPVYVPVANPLPATSPAKIDNLEVVYIGSLSSGVHPNDPPVITTTTLSAALNQPYSNLGILTDSTQEQPVEEYFFRVLGPAGGTTKLHPNDETPPGDPGPAVIVDPKTGKLGFNPPDDFIETPDRPTVTGSWLVELGARSVFGTSYKTVTLTVKAPINYTNWLALNFTPAERENAQIGADQADADGDGVPTVLEFAMGTNPRAPQDPEMPSLTQEGDEVVLRWQKDTNMLGATIGVQYSEDLSFWQEGTPVETSRQGSITNFEYRMPVADGRKFVRLRGTAN